MLSAHALAELDELNSRLQLYGETSIRSNLVILDIIETLVVIHRFDDGCASEELHAWSLVHPWPSQERSEEVARFFGETADTVLRTLRLTNKLPLRRKRPEFPRTQTGPERRVNVPA